MSNGGKHALYNAFLSILDPGDEVIVPAPYWVSYPEMIRLADGVPVELPTTEATGFRVTIDQLDAAVTPKTKALLFVSPSNPTGAVYPPRRDGGDRPLGRRPGALGGHRRDLRAPRLRGQPSLLDARPGAGARGPLSGHQRRG